MIKIDYPYLSGFSLSNTSVMRAPASSVDLREEVGALREERRLATAALGRLEAALHISDLVIIESQRNAIFGKHEHKISRLAVNGSLYSSGVSSNLAYV